jgi:hypothetical protein
VRIRIFNAFASNNSGSYTIVGSFPASALATEIAVELAELMAAQTAWLEAEAAKQKFPLKGESPLQRFVQKHDLTWYDHMGTDDEWPDYDTRNAPQAFAIGHKVIIHHEYTVTMPRVFGEYFYARGGRVDHELDHAHHPVIGLIEMWIPWKERAGVDVPAKVSAIVEELNAEDGPLVKDVPLWFEPAWQSKGGFGEADLTVGAVFKDLMVGFSAVQRIATAHGLQTTVKVFEAFGNTDSLAFLRPSSPRLEARLCSVVIEARGDAPDALSQAVASLVHYDYPAAHRLLATVPVTVMSGLVAARAESVAATLRHAGATVSIKVEPRAI